MGKYIENGINIDPKPLTVEEFSIAGNINGKVSVSKEHINMMTKGAPIRITYTRSTWLDIHFMDGPTSTCSAHNSIKFL